MEAHEYIERNALLKEIHRAPAEAHNERCAQLLEAILYAPTADVVPRMIIFDLERKLHSMLPFKAYPIPIDGKCTGNSYELGKEHVIYDILNYLGEFEEKYMKGE